MRWRKVSGGWKRVDLRCGGGKSPTRRRSPTAVCCDGCNYSSSASRAWADVDDEVEWSVSVHDDGRILMWWW